ncbi:AGE family epimerase/isomerase [Allosaccharopolyspora coralli]|uniref:AGE family epimerase/isomerase n=1 Tax=Allosaccharopolyspora coralli TaxID=2665642 RepID=A0A5Q3QAY7_9PSEU|nr:AGE family epimerase/isomerase [Allosaccharopolyspora coralli]QGK68779.1 AGE family epimerase/isomerase [Allosaccharopolyspora coralli]
MRDPHQPGGAAWRQAEAQRLLEFASRSVLPDGGFGYLDSQGTPDSTRRELWITARMTHVFGLAALAGHPGARDHAAHGVRALIGLFHDPANGGWVESIDSDGTALEVSKTFYGHCFVLLAASTAYAARLSGAEDLLHRAQRVIERHFWDESHGLGVESFSREWTLCEDYRGANSNMHAVEAFTACSDATGEPLWRQRAMSIAERIVGGFTRDHGWRMPEHFSADWSPLLEYNAKQPADKFRPYGTTVGHWLEWSRLLVGLHERGGPAWLLDAATTLFDESVRVGWAADGAPGFVYTLDWEDAVVVAERMHWVQAEAVLAADALYRAAEHEEAAELAEQWWRFLADHFVDTAGGSWHHELGSDLGVSTTVWPGKPDVYHAYQAVVFPDLPLAPAAATALARRGGVA